MAQADGKSKLTHLDDQGRPTMVDVGAKPSTERIAAAGCKVRLNAETFALLKDNNLPKGDVLVTARLAGIQAAKKTSDLIPLCHPLFLSFVDVDISLNEDETCLDIRAEARTTGPTGVEMEAVTAASVAALTVYDMVKAVQRDVVIDGLRLLYKSGGKSGLYTAE